MTPEEQALGASTAPATLPTRALKAPPMDEFERLYYTMPSDELKHRYRTDPEFRAQVDAMNAGPAQPAIEEVPPAPAPVAPSATPTPEQVLVETVEPPAPAPVPVEEPTSKSIFKEGDRWCRVVDLGDGSGAQRFYGHTKDELIDNLAEAQLNATRMIRHQQAEKRQAENDRKQRDRRKKDAELLLENAEKLEVKQYKSRALTADEQWQIANSTQDPAQLCKALDIYMSAKFGASPDEVVNALNAGEVARIEQNAQNVGRVWVSNNDDFYASPENISRMTRFMQDQNPAWAITEKNLDKAFRYLESHDQLEERPSEVEEIVVPTPAPPAIPAAAPVVAAPATAAPAPATAPAATNQPVPTINIPAIPGATVLGVRPGSVSTALSPRDSSVRSTSAAPRPVGLTVEEYHKTPAAEIRRKMQRDPAYKAAVEHLWETGQV